MIGPLSPADSAWFRAGPRVAAAQGGGGAAGPHRCDRRGGGRRPPNCRRAVGGACTLPRRGRMHGGGRRHRRHPRHPRRGGTWLTAVALLPPAFALPPAPLGTATACQCLRAPRSAPPVSSRAALPADARRLGRGGLPLSLYVPRGCRSLGTTGRDAIPPAACKHPSLGPPPPL